MNRLELVAPAGGWKQLVAAVNGGADSIYLGYKRFGARAFAENFDLRGLEKAVDYAHQRSKKIYLTVNTLIKDHEFEDILSFLSDYINICADGLIIQDIGLLKAIRDIFGDIRLHASTQLNIHNVAGAAFLKKAGLKRVVLARELDLARIKGFKDRGLELEVFGHGSQCFSFSGQCLFSSFIGGRSGNRGRCPQPCRMRYDVLSAEKNTRLTKTPSHILSKNDIFSLKLLPELIKSGVDALKIEGRMKSADYVGIVVSTYRKYIDRYYKDPEGYEVYPEDIYKLKQIFSRELSTGYLEDDYPEDIISHKKSGSVGNFLGRIKDISYKKTNRISSIEIKSKWPIRKGDILEIWTNKGNERITVKSIKRQGQELKDKSIYRINIESPLKLSVKDRVFKFFDAKLDREAKKLYEGKDDKASPRSNRQASSIFSASVHDYMSKRSGNIYRNEKIDIIPVIHDRDVLGDMVDEGIEKLVVGQSLFDRSGQIFPLLSGAQKNFIISTPAIIYDDNLDRLLKRIEEIPDYKKVSYEIENIGFLKEMMDMGPGIKMYLGQAFNVFNSFSIDYFNEILGDRLKGIELSPELNLEEINQVLQGINGIGSRLENISIYGYGYNPVMRARYKIDFYKRLSKPSRKTEDDTGDLYMEDRQRYRFRLAQERDDLVFFNSKKTCMLFDMDKLIEAGIGCIKVDTRFLSRRDALKVVNTFKKASEMLYISRKKYLGFTEYFREDILFKDYSKGHLYRGTE